MNRPPIASFACPCCGGDMDAVARVCTCGARLVGEPLLDPPSPKPMVGSAVASVLCAMLALLSVWFRPMLVFGVFALIASIRALRAGRANPERFGGARIARTGLVLGCAALVGVGSWWAAGIPRAIERSREQQAAATRAEMYALSSRMISYRARFGAFPSRLSDLERLDDAESSSPARDGWDRRIAYAAFTSGIASRGRTPQLNANFELRSPGPDGVPNTSDDIVMRDGQIVDGGASEAAPTGRLPMTVPVSNHIR